MSCSSERYAEEASAVRDFLASRGESLTAKLMAQREKASATLEFEEAAAIHARLKKVETVRGQVNDVVRALDQLKALILQPAADSDAVALFLFDQGFLQGPVMFSTLGMRHANEQSGSSSLFAQPVSLEPIALAESGKESTKAILVTRDVLEERLLQVFESLESHPRQKGGGTDVLTAQLCLFTRWYYRPERKRIGEVFFLDPQVGWPTKAILRGISRVFLENRKSMGLQAVTLNAQGDAR
jgi:excinuclease UvrABC nuclease subunit